MAGSPRSAPYSGPQPVVNPAAPSPYQPQNAAPGVSLSEAVQAAHEEGQEFGGSVARDAPALWLEAVLARKPRMPSDLEARLWQAGKLGAKVVQLPTPATPDGPTIAMVQDPEGHRIGILQEPN